MYGCSEGMLRSLFEGKTPWGDPIPGGEHTDPALVAISLLSDVQELMSIVAENIVGYGLGQEQDRLELARQLVNRAKFGINEYMRRPRARTEEGR